MDKIVFMDKVLLVNEF